MTSKERVLAAVNHVQPDRAPIDMPLAPEVRRALEARLGLSGQALEDWIGQDFAFVGPRFKHAASDICYADPTIEVTAEGHYLDVWRVPFKVVRTEFQTYVDLAGRPPLAACESIEDLDRFPWPSPDAWDYSNIPGDLKANRDKATWGHSRGFFEIAHFMRGMEHFLPDLALRPDVAGALMDHIAGYLLERSRRILEAGRGGFTVFEYNDDVASQNTLFISPGMWREHIKPRMARFCRLIHEHGAKVRYHCCGSARAILPDLIEIGVDILNPVQPLAAGMDPFELKAAFGDRLTLHGGIDIQNLLPHGSPEEVASATRRMISVVGKNGGYIVGGSHVIQADAPVENVVAMIQEARRPV